ncbi:ABC transporter permease [Piscinibacter sakaiensis]|uniref:ABC transporter permease n=1 Tax=Piscinibacter sakaiensis TaxID=1547922 RepID=UPI000B0C9D30|nr:ABC transporter permease [Piscinibacter sakaiensis]
MNTRTDREGARAAPTGLSRSFAIQCRIIGALFLREVLTRYGRHNIGFFWLFVEPMIFTALVTALWTAIGANHGSSIPIVAFGLTGYSTALLWRNMPNRTLGAIEPNLSLMYHRNVKVIDIYMSRILLEVGGVTASFVILAFAFTAFEWMQPPEDILKVMFAWLMLCWFGVALGLAIGAVGERYTFIGKLWGPMSYILFPLSGAAFIVDALPPGGRDYILLLPMVHGVELLREGYFGSAVRSHYDLGYMAACCLALTLFGMAGTRIVGRDITP